MHKDAFILLLLLATFALMGADCQAPWDNKDDEKRPLPDRALASSGLLRAYYDTRTFPEEMREIKIPEGTGFDEDELTVEFEMGGAETVTEVRTHLYLMPPLGKGYDECELVCRCEAPDGSKSSWKTVDVQFETAFTTSAEVQFLFEFDGMTSDGLWKIQLRDDFADGDGRCLFRNGSLHVNQGEDSTPGGAASETQTLNITNGNYGAVPEESGKRQPMDIGWFGVDRMLRNDFTFTSSFFVRTVTMRVSMYMASGVEDGRVSFLLVSPSGNWISSGFGFTAAGEVDFTTTVLKTFDFSISSTSGILRNFNGEPSAGTWSLYLVDTIKDQNVVTLTTDEGDSTLGVLPNSGALSLQLDGIG